MPERQSWPGAQKTLGRGGGLQLWVQPTGARLWRLTYRLGGKQKLLALGVYPAIYRRLIDLASGRFAVIEKTREFTLVPWRPVLERSLGKQVSGIMRGDSISWTIGRQRGGPSVS